MRINIIYKNYHNFTLGLAATHEREDGENIFANPFKRFDDMHFIKRCRDVKYVEFNNHIWKRLTQEEKEWIVEWCDIKLNEYYMRKDFTS